MAATSVTGTGIGESFGKQKRGNNASCGGGDTEEEAKRFIVALTQALDRPESDGETVGDLIGRLKLSNEFLSTWFVGGVIHYFAGHPLQYYLDYPARLLAWMWLNNAAREKSESIELLKVDNQE